MRVFRRLSMWISLSALVGCSDAPEPPSAGRSVQTPRCVATTPTENATRACTTLCAQRAYDCVASRGAETLPAVSLAIDSRSGMGCSGVTRLPVDSSIGPAGSATEVDLDCECAAVRLQMPGSVLSTVGPATFSTTALSWQVGGWTLTCRPSVATVPDVPQTDVEDATSASDVIARDVSPGDSGTADDATAPADGDATTGSDVPDGAPIVGQFGASQGMLNSPLIPMIPYAVASGSFTRGPTMSMSDACTHETIAGCEVTRCPEAPADGGVSVPSYVSAGVITVEGPLGTLSQTSADGLYLPSLTPHLGALWSSGDTVSIRAAGSPGGMPPFAASLVGPASITLTSPVLDLTVSPPPTISSASPLTFRWTGGDASPLEVRLVGMPSVSRTNVTVLCGFPSLAGMGTIATAALAPLAGSPTVTIGGQLRVGRTLSIGPHRVDLSLTTIGFLGTVSVE